MDPVTLIVVGGGAAIVYLLSTGKQQQVENKSPLDFGADLAEKFLKGFYKFNKDAVDYFETDFVEQLGGDLKEVIDGTTALGGVWIPGLSEALKGSEGYHTLKQESMVMDGIMMARFEKEDPPDAVTILQRFKQRRNNSLTRFERDIYRAAVDMYRNKKHIFGTSANQMRPSKKRARQMFKAIQAGFSSGAYNYTRATHPELPPGVVAAVDDSVSWNWFANTIKTAEAIKKPTFTRHTGDSPTYFESVDPMSNAIKYFKTCKVQHKPTDGNFYLETIIPRHTYWYARLVRIMGDGKAGYTSDVRFDDLASDADLDNIVRHAYFGDRRLATIGFQLAGEAKGKNGKSDFWKED